MISWLGLESIKYAFAGPVSNYIIMQMLDWYKNGSKFYRVLYSLCSQDVTSQSQTLSYWHHWTNLNLQSDCEYLTLSHKIHQDGFPFYVAHLRLPIRDRSCFRCGPTRQTGLDGRCAHVPTKHECTHTTNIYTVLLVKKARLMLRRVTCRHHTHGWDLECRNAIRSPITDARANAAPYLEQHTQCLQGASHAGVVSPNSTRSVTDHCWSVQYVTSCTRPCHCLP